MNEKDDDEVPDIVLIESDGEDDDEVPDLAENFNEISKIEVATQYTKKKVPIIWKISLIPKKRVKLNDI